ncbi:hypothetical protein CISG_08970 [Coccidioides immitis RMSCC 3703]|uniref:Uncharacterized protein n=2 Tax=Coccidioides immitis TaxID=5501 RepID=A0A0J8R8S6_COCIT|nr:hypothetical protein CIRG_05481 [Coccidioides immitis RMSCC 2394]KMU80845.1 hypothetical protein CISG_08970 [Coccidioides immitis RMSCC 3703]
MRGGRRPGIERPPSQSPTQLELAISWFIPASITMTLSDAPLNGSRLINHFAGRWIRQQLSSPRDFAAGDPWDWGKPSPALINIFEERHDLFCPLTPDGRSKKALIPLDVMRPWNPGSLMNTISGASRPAVRDSYAAGLLVANSRAFSVPARTYEKGEGTRAERLYA